MHVAFATVSQEKIDAHFGIAPGFAVYDVSPKNIQYIAMIYPTEQDAEADKIESRAEVLRGCTVVYCTQIGGPAAARLVQQNIHPLKVQEGTSIESELQRFQTMLKETPPPWISKRLKEETESKEETCQCLCTKD